MRVVVLGGYAPSLIVFRGTLLGEIARRGHEVLAMAADGTPAITRHLDELRVTYEEVPLARAGMNPMQDAGTLAYLVRRLRAYRPEVLLTYTIKPVIYGGLAGRLSGVPRRFAMITGLGYTFLGGEHWRRRMLTRGVTALYRAGLAGSHTVFFQNPDDRAEFERRRLVPRGAQRQIVRGSGVDVDHYAVAPAPGGPAVFLFIGRLLREKGIFDYVEAARRLRARRRDVRFLVLGGLDPNPASASASDVQAWAREGIIEYLGEVSDVRPVIAHASVLVLPSYREGTPRSVLEAMSMGRAVITTDAPGCRETVIDGDNGLLVPVRDPGALATAMEALAAESARRTQMGARGRKRAEELYDARVVAAAMIEAMDL